MDNGKVLHASRDGVHVLRFVGEIRYTLSPSIDRYLDGIFSATPPSGFVIDLTGTDSIDSTNLGILARIAKSMLSINGSRVTVVSDRPDINSVLTSMALDEVFDITDHNLSVSAPEQELPQDDADRATLSRTLIDAHRTLMELNERNEEMFRDVVVALEQNSD